MKKLLLLVTALLTAEFAAADECQSWGCSSLINTLLIYADGTVKVGTPLLETNANCTPADGGYYFTLSPTAVRREEQYSALLAAYIAQQKVQMVIVQNSNPCEINYIRLDSNL
ncbi:MAG: hypothetical protein KUG79_14000 [Pseudomonadales bacterium]|nr:hypothetical protein [Pseudomonadales bacterium]